MRRITVVITSRASYARIKTALEAISAHPDLSLSVIAAGSAVLERYGNVAEIIEADGFAVTRVLSVFEGGTPEAMVRSTAALMTELGGLFARERPDAVVTIADRHETLATAVAAAYQNIPLVHVQGGEFTGSIDDRVRWAVGQLADLHLVATASAEVLMEQWSLGTADVRYTGCPSIDIAARAQPLQELTAGAGNRIDLSRSFLIVMNHADTTDWHAAKAQTECIYAAVSRLGYPSVWFWPNVDAGTEAISKAMRTHTTGVAQRYVRNLSPEDFCGLAKRAACIVGNSSFGIREASFLGLPAVNVGDRQRGRERGPNVVDVPYDAKVIRDAIKAQVGRAYEPSFLYGDGHAGERIATVLAEYLGKREAA